MKLLKYLWNNGDMIASIIFFFLGNIILIFTKDWQTKELGIAIIIMSLWFKLDAILKKEITVKNYFINRNNKITISQDLEPKSYDDLFYENQELKRKLTRQTNEQD